MMYSNPAAEVQANYGLDAPGFQRGALFGGVAALVVGLAFAILAGHGVLPRVLQPASGIMWPGAWFFLTRCVTEFCRSWAGPG